MVGNFSELSVNFVSAFTNISFMEYLATIKVLIILVASMVIYSLFIFKFYKFLAKRDILELDLDRYSIMFEGFIKTILKFIFYVVENIIITPILVFIWFSVLTVLLLLITKHHSPDTILLTTISLVATIRICSYYNEDLSKDLAKIIPLTLLAIFLMDYVAVFSLDNIRTLIEIIPLWNVALYYLVFVVAVELFLRIIEMISKFFKK